MAAALWSSNIFDFLGDNADFFHNSCQDLSPISWPCQQSRGSSDSRKKMRKHSTQAAGDRVSRSQRPKVSDHSRKRTAIACTRCRKRKIKCSGAEPGKRCETCHNAGEECVTDRVGQIIPLTIEPNVDSIQEEEMSPGSGLLTPASSHRHGSVASMTSTTSGRSQPGPFEYAPLGYVDRNPHGSFHGRPSVSQPMPVNYYQPQVNHYHHDRSMPMPAFPPHYGPINPYTTLPPLRGEGLFATSQHGQEAGRALPIIDERQRLSVEGQGCSSTVASQDGLQSFSDQAPSTHYHPGQPSTSSQRTPSVPTADTTSSSRQTSKPAPNPPQLATPQSSLWTHTAGHMPSPTDTVLLHPRRASGYTTAPYPLHSSNGMSTPRTTSIAAAQAAPPGYSSGHAAYTSSQSSYSATHQPATYGTNTYTGQYMPYYHYDTRHHSGRQHSHLTQPYGPPTTTQEIAYPMPGQAGPNPASSQRQTEGHQHQQGLDIRTGKGHSRVQ